MPGVRVLAGSGSERAIFLLGDHALLGDTRVTLRVKPRLIPERGRSQGPEPVTGPSIHVDVSGLAQKLV
jgi:hypothetical protein